jgi:hypothetical protein
VVGANFDGAAPVGDAEENSNAGQELGIGGMPDWLGQLAAFLGW